MSLSTEMDSATPHRKPTFFWQSVLILVPILGLSVVGFFFVRQDKSLVLEQARSDSKRLGNDISRKIEERWDQQSQSLNWDLIRPENQTNLDWRRRIEDYHVPLAPFRQMVETFLMTGIPPHFGSYTGLQRGGVFGGFVVSPNGQLVQPQLYPAVPINSGGSFEEQLSAEQRSLMPTAETNVAACERLLTTKLPAALTARVQLFLATLLRTNNPTRAQALLDSIINSTNELNSPGGLPLQVLAAYEAVRGSISNHLDRETIVLESDVLVSNAVKHPSLISARLVEEATNVVHSLGEEPVNRIALLPQWWRDEAARQFFADLRDNGLVRPEEWKQSKGFWWPWQGEDRLVLVSPSDNGNVRITVASEAWVEVLLLEALDSTGIRLPEYAGVSLQVYGKSFPRVPGERKSFPYWMSGPWLDIGAGGYVDLLWNTKVDPAVSYDFKLMPADIPQTSPNAEILAQTSGEMLEKSGAPAVGVQLRLAKPKALFALQQLRVRFFGLLIAAAALAAAIGWIAAYRAFRRQFVLNEMKSSFVSSVSHELRAPIASIRLMAEGLERGKIAEPTKQKQYFGFITQECRRLSSLIENVLDFARIEQGRKLYEMEPTDVWRLTEETVGSMEPYAEEKQVKLQCVSKTAPREELPQPTIDGRAIQQALINLIDNAIKHSPAGKTVSVTLSHDADVIRWSVSDEGTGIPPEEHEKIFDRFYRLGSELRRETQGVGIGLSIVKHIVDAHGGRVVVRSDVGKGSQFTIELPMNKRNEACHES